MNTNAINVQAQITFGWIGIESVPNRDWRETLDRDGACGYRHEVEGLAKVVCEDGRERNARIEVAIFGKKRNSSLGGLVTKWSPRPSKGSVHAQCRVKTFGGGIEFDGPVTFTEPDIVDAYGAVHSPSEGLVLKASLAQGKTLRLTDVELRPKLHRDGPLKGQPVVGADGTQYLQAQHFGGIAVADRPQVQDELADDDAEVSVEGVAVRQAARKTAMAAPADIDAEGAI